MKDLESIAFLKVLEMGETTEGMNGYPKNLKPIMLCGEADNFDEIKAIAEEYDLEIVKLHKKAGWDLWENKGRTNKPYHISGSDYGDNYRGIGKMKETDYVKNEITDGHRFDDCEDFEELHTRLHMHKIIYDEIEEMEDDEIVIIGYGEFYDTIKKRPISWLHDTHMWTIGLIEKE